jgi:hypothetical protein
MNARKRIRRIQRWIAAAKRNRTDDDFRMPDVERTHARRKPSDGADIFVNECSFQRRMLCNRLFAAELAWLVQYALDQIYDELLDDHGPGRCEECGYKLTDDDLPGDDQCRACSVKWAEDGNDP